MHTYARGGRAVSTIHAPDRSQRRHSVGRGRLARRTLTLELEPIVTPLDSTPHLPVPITLLVAVVVVLIAVAALSAGVMMLALAGSA